MWDAEALLINFKGIDWDVNKSSDLRFQLGIHAHIFAPQKIQGRGSGGGAPPYTEAKKAEKFFCETGP